MERVNKLFRRSKKTLVEGGEPLKGSQLISGGGGLESASSDGGRISERTTNLLERISPLDLQKFYIMEPLLFAGINVYVKEVVPGFKLKGKDKESLRVINKFMEDVNFGEILTKIVIDLGIFGNAFQEKIPLESDPIVDLVGIDPKTMHFMKDTEGRIIEDKTRRALGYYQDSYRPPDNLNAMIEDICNKGRVPKEDVGPFTGIPFSRSKIVHYRLNILSETEMGLGLIEPLYDTVMLKLKVEEALGKGLQRVGVPQTIATLGTPEHPIISGAEKKKLDDQLDNLTGLDYLTLPHYIKLNQTKIEKIEKLQEYLLYWVDQICTGMGIPHSVILRGERVGSGVADTHEDQLQKNIANFQETIARITEREIFKPICLARRLPEVPKLVWERKSFAQHKGLMFMVSELTRAAQLTPDRKTEEWIRNILGMPSVANDSKAEKERREERRTELIKRKDSKE